MEERACSYKLLSNSVCVPFPQALLVPDIYLPCVFSKCRQNCSWETASQKIKLDSEELSLTGRFHLSYLSDEPHDIAGHAIHLSDPDQLSEEDPADWMELNSNDRQNLRRAAQMHQVQIDFAHMDAGEGSFTWLTSNGQSDEGVSQAKCFRLEVKLPTGDF